MTLISIFERSSIFGRFDVCVRVFSQLKIKARFFLLRFTVVSKSTEINDLDKFY